MDFLTQLIRRLFSETPAFFKVLRNISIVLAVITGLPLFLENTGIDLPDAWDAIASKIISYASIAAAFVAQLTATDKAKAENEIK